MKTMKDLEALALPELRALARDAGMHGYSRLRRSALLTALAAAMGIKEESAQTLTPEDEQAVADVKIVAPTPELSAPSETPSLPEPSPVDRGFGFPMSYGVDRCVLMVRDPQWMFAYWDVSADKWDLLVKSGATDPAEGWRRVLRLHDVTGRADDELTADSLVADIELSNDARDWYFQTPRPDREYAAEFGYLGPNGAFRLVARSNVVEAPRSAPSDEMDATWGRLYDEALRLSLAAGGATANPTGDRDGAALSQLMNEHLSSGPFSAELVRR